MNYKLFTVQFLKKSKYNNNNFIDSRLYSFKVAADTFEFFLKQITKEDLTSSTYITSFYIKNELNYDYDNARVVISRIEDLIADTKDSSVSYRTLVAVIPMGRTMPVSDSEHEWVNKVNRTYDLTMIEAEPEFTSQADFEHSYTTQWASNPSYDNNDLSNHSNPIIEKENNMFNNLVKKFNFGKIPSSKVKMSTMGMAILDKERSAFAYDDDKEQFVDVTDFVFDDFDFFYAMPVSKKEVEEGDYIIHNHEIVRVVEVNDRGNLIVYRVFDQEEITVLATRNILGFDFYTKIINIAGNFFNINEADNNAPFGNMLPMLLLKGDKKDSNGLLMMLMMQSQVGNTNSQDFMSNPMMMYFLMQNGDDSNDNNLLPLLMMSNSSLFNFNQNEEK